MIGHSSSGPSDVLASVLPICERSRDWLVRSRKITYYIRCEPSRPAMYQNWFSGDPSWLWLDTAGPEILRMFIHQTDWVPVFEIDLLSVVARASTNR